ncbi:polyprenol monophosphomannose synthase [Cellulomonas fimi]|uniref:Glycosyl transferase family 2 n=1 Tax=Cellulomonas fimi (strain ATCC 484 / DSM 20113 / JCM 1341 / CCUG 24087 / LMG 16345 / NBRC 15513 / NCIMB 8980 / NCTC 7547 / NRS-133) TaxID=590998 RepID=F4GZN3_CELFA|nr:polyprenol monophosphomannose synthase [Cellulomonas fimi]AEE46077.1 glycosyl transferase family 2 [Cellulomonas fimi ATCC 484]NNH06928.1 polyprenol monophosphomannose synthase [Cellulomonas fimi]VEH31535.1 Undecaprenyl-phosphate 4-deoxy-4-formamido-L-arabinose transferase [Cellulomonas fimi]
MNPSAARVLVVIPTYDERENIPVVLERLREHVPTADVLVVDDGSPDGTGEVAEKIAADEAAATDARRAIAVLHRSGKLGLGTAYVAGFGWALERGYDVVVEMDADGSHRAQDLPRLLARVSDADLVLGSRWVPGGSVVNWPAHRKVLSVGGNTYTRLVLGIPLRDATGGFRAYRADLLRSLPLGEVASQGYCFQVDMAWRAVRAGARVVEVPITFVEREVGRSKMSRAIVAEALLNVTRWGMRERSRRVAGAFGRSRG